MTPATMPFVEADRISGEQAPHGPAQWYCAGSQQEVKMVGDQRPGEAARITAAQNRPQAIEKPLPVRVIIKNLAAGDPTHNDMVQGAGRIDA